MQALTKIRNDIHTALKHQELAEAELKLAQKAYDEKLAELEAQNHDIVLRRNQAIVKHDDAKQALTIARASAKEELEYDWADDLPEGFKQNRRKTVVYDPQGFRKQALEYFPFLLQLNEKAVDKFFASMATEEKDGGLMLPEEIRSLTSVEVIYTIQPTISNSTISKLKIDDTQDLTIFANALEDIEENSPADENQLIKDVYQIQVIEPIDDETVIPSEDLYS